MKELSAKIVAEAVKNLAMNAAYNLGEDVIKAFASYRKKEESPLGKEILQKLQENAKVAAKEEMPMCQDTGVAVLFVDVGQDLHITGGSLIDALHQGVREGYTGGYLRASMVKDPLDRVNTKDNTPAIIHLNVVPGDKLKITLTAKGGGSENMSALKMLKPSDGVEGVKKFVIDTVDNAGANPCPPVIVGVGIGGNFEMAPYLAKKSLLRQIGERNPNPFYANLEKELLEKINCLGIGPQGMGGTTTALDVFIEVHPCHIVALPVAVNIQCHAQRHKEITL